MAIQEGGDPNGPVDKKKKILVISLIYYIIYPCACECFAKEIQ